MSDDERDGTPPRADRRTFLGVAAAGAAGAAVAAVTGCDTAPSRTASRVNTTAGALPTVGPQGLIGADWRIRTASPAAAIQGYTDKVSVLPGESFGLHVSTTAPGFRVAAFRVGWYGGAQARLIWASRRVRGALHDRSELLVATRTVRAGWKRSLTVRTGGWPAGAYLLRLDAEGGHQRYVPLVVRSATAAGKTLIMHAPATWQAYNTWGGYSLYRGRDTSYANRSLVVSFDRPYDGNGAEKFMVYERAAVVLAEKLGIPLAYTTGVDVHRSPSVLRGATTAVALGHDEYWTPEQRRHVGAARDAGTNLVFLGANTCFRRVRLEAGPRGAARVVACYKTDFRVDPYLVAHPTMATTDFRDRPGADPESSLTGVMYDGYPVDAPYVVESPDHWVFAGTGAARGDSFAHLVGVEYDRVNPDFPHPGALEILAHSPVSCQGRQTYSDSAYYTVPGGAGVFATGTMRWVEGLMAATGEDGRDHGMDARTRAFVTRTTENVLRGFAEGRAGTTRPAPRANVAALYGA
ncbi:N,N-dimethylformamidase beta subunit family domain-containing protein [Streptomyces sp. NBC_01190]|uniref:N,N-dimethylformamidase beta subunit family domain-containing protein n=1 Tax=Streptomyces sp. NBC_01190 TaxID=2903767 RepID=UPI003869DAF5|nr:hypothetical protein OG519_26865 [Streptomyces sp. NBC_01190]